MKGGLQIPEILWVDKMTMQMNFYLVHVLYLLSKDSLCIVFYSRETNYMSIIVFIYHRCVRQC